MHIFTYGTLMFPQVWQAVVGRSFATVTGTLRGFAIYRVCDAVFPGIIKAGTESRVPGVVYLDVDEASLKRLDQFEDAIYCRETVMIDCHGGGVLQADAYVVPPEQFDALTDEPWCGEEFCARGDLERFVARYGGFRRLAGGDPQ